MTDIFYPKGKFDAEADAIDELSAAAAVKTLSHISTDVDRSVVHGMVMAANVAFRVDAQRDLNGDSWEEIAKARAMAFRTVRELMAFELSAFDEPNPLVIAPVDIPHSGRLGQGDRDLWTKEVQQALNIMKAVEENQSRNMEFWRRDAPENLRRSTAAQLPFARYCRNLARIFAYATTGSRASPLAVSRGHQRQTPTRFIMAASDELLTAPAPASAIRSAYQLAGRFPGEKTSKKV